ncbi:MAG: TIGR02680 family protein, partial [Thermoleophilaceae bacterium]
MTRFVPVRAGIMALYEYDDVVFELAGGRLLLRGHNTSGKTKALELLLPFCLDGDISPRKLDPFARSAKEMKWNLLGRVERDQQIGYVWLEFERLGAAGVERLTCGVGMRADRGREGVRRWYFLIRDRRVGEDVSLRRGDNPLTRSQLAELLGDGDELLGSPGEYRRALNRALYGFPSVDQYETMIGLLLELRRPHLSKSLDHGEVTRLLSASLPEIDHELMRRLGEGIEQLDQLQAALDRLEGVRELLDGFVASAYAPYARALTSDRRDRLRAANTGFDRASAERRRRAEDRDRAGADAEATV